MLPLFEPPFLRTGAYQLPLFEGPVPVEMLKLLRGSDAPLEVLKSRKLKVCKWTSRRAPRLPQRGPAHQLLASNAPSRWRERVRVESEAIAVK